MSARSSSILWLSACNLPEKGKWVPLPHSYSSHILLYHHCISFCSSRNKTLPFLSHKVAHKKRDGKNVLRGTNWVFASHVCLIPIRRSYPGNQVKEFFFVVVVLTLVSAFDKFIYLFILACLLNSEDHTIGLSLLTKTNILLKSWKSWLLFLTLVVENYLNIGIPQFVLNLPLSSGDHNWRGRQHILEGDILEGESGCNPRQKERDRDTLESRFLILPVGCFPTTWLAYLLNIVLFRCGFQGGFSWTDYAYLT